MPNDNPPLEGAVGASDANNGGGSGAGIPDGDTQLRVGPTVNKGDPQRDKEKLFPNAAAKPAGEEATEFDAQRPGERPAKGEGGEEALQEW